MEAEELRRPSPAMSAFRAPTGSRGLQEPTMEVGMHGPAPRSPRHGQELAPAQDGGFDQASSTQTPPATSAASAGRSAQSSRRTSARLRKTKRTSPSSTQQSSVRQQKHQRSARSSARRSSSPRHRPIESTEPPRDRNPRSDLATLHREVPDPGTRLSTAPPRLFATRCQRRHELWQFVKLATHPDNWYLSDAELENKHAAFAFCTRCKMTIAFKTSQHKVAQHMERYHLRELNECACGENEPPVQRNLAEELTEAGTLREISPDEQKHLNMLLARWVAAHFRPLIIVEDAGFLEFIAFITEKLCGVHVAIPKRAQLRGCIISVADELRIFVCADIEQSCEYFSITCDIWTSRNPRSYIAFTIHYLTESFEARNWTLEVRELPGKHDAASIWLALEEIMEVWRLRKEYCTQFVHDSGSNMVAAGDCFGVEHTPCLAHELHLVLSGALAKKKKKKEAPQNSRPAWESVVAQEPGVVENEHEEDDTLNEDERADMETLRENAIDELDTFLDDTLLSLEKTELESMREVVQTFRTLSVYFRKSPKAYNRLAEIQKKQLRVSPGDVVNLVVDCPTRWNSCWTMLERCIRLEPALDKFFEHLFTYEGRVEFDGMHKKLSKPTHKQWLAIRCLCVLLGPFESVSRNLGGQLYPALPAVLPALDALERVLRNRQLFDNILNAAGKEAYVDEVRVLMLECQAAMRRLFTERFDNLKTSKLVWIAFLDPRMAMSMSHLTAENREKAYTDCLDAAVELAELHAPPPQNSVSIVPPDPDKVDFFTQFVLKATPGESSLTPLRKACAQEIESYLAAARALSQAGKVDPLAWWAGNRSNYPYLSRLARKWLGAVATSVPSERAFSTSGNIITAKRSSLTPDLVRDLVFIAENSKRTKRGGA